jgi:ABC-type nitrate/sulfonate/bicarbonate transport system ATPase subunit
MHMLLKHIRKKHGTTILMVTHDFHDALSLSDRIFLLSDGCITKDWIIDDHIRSNPEAMHRYTREMREAL